jgi:hypothetical protein
MHDSMNNQQRLNGIDETALPYGESNNWKRDSPMSNQILTTSRGEGPNLDIAWIKRELKVFLAVVAISFAAICAWQYFWK